ncbi:MAG: murein biosynthesis integral membrane protein MurJ [Clostridiales bacterium]|nr:murein biosynthesis integral membrane protein MurJ [Clostridiales bacterium]
MKKAAFLVMIITIVSKFLGFGREIVLSYVYGASAITDAYLISQTIPLTIFSFISVGVATGFIPMYSRIRKESGQISANEFISNLSNTLILVASAIVVIVLVFTQPVVKLFASGFTGETMTLAVSFTRITIFGVYFTAILHIFVGYLRVHENYLVAALIGFPMNFITIGALFISKATNVYVLAVGSLLATASQLIILIPFVRKAGFTYKPIFDLKDEHIKSMVLIALPVIAGTSVNEINVLVDRTLASGIAVGGISALNYARRLNGFVQGLFVASITTVMYPMISRMAAEDNINGLKSTISESISIISLLVVPATVGAMIFSEEIVSLLFGRGAFTLDAIKMTGNALFYYSIGMIAFGLRDILSRAFYALQDTKTPMINATIAVVLNIVLNIILSKFLGIGGLALATSISAIVGTGLLFITLRRKIGGFGLKEISMSFIKISIASVIMGFIALGSFNFLKLDVRENIALIAAIGIGAIVYGVLVFFLRIPEVERTLELMKGKLRGRVGEKSE